MTASGYAVLLTPQDKRYPIKRRKLFVSQKGKVFDPLITVVTKGSTINFLNDDNVKHNAWSMSKVRRFDLGMLEENQEPRVSFRKTGKVEVFCNLHAKMFALVWVVDSPFYSVVDENYRFNIKDVPDGNYKVEVLYYLSPKKPLMGIIKIKGKKIVGPSVFSFKSKKNKSRRKSRAKRKIKRGDDY